MNPTRYDMVDPNEDSFGPTATMEVDPTGRYVKWEEYRVLRSYLTSLVQSCTPMPIPSDVGYPGTKAPDKAILEAARGLIQSL